MDKTSRDLFICAKHLFIEAKEGQLAPLHFCLTNRINIPAAINRAIRIPTTNEITGCRVGLTSFDPAPFCAAPIPNQKRSLSIKSCSQRAPNAGELTAAKLAPSGRTANAKLGIRALALTDNGAESLARALPVLRFQLQRAQGAVCKASPCSTTQLPSKSVS